MYGDTKTPKDRLNPKKKATGIFGKRASMSKALEQKTPKGAEKEIEKENKKIAKCGSCKKAPCIC